GGNSDDGGGFAASRIEGIARLDRKRAQLVFLQVLPFSSFHAFTDCQQFPGKHQAATLPHRADLKNRFGPRARCIFGSTCRTAPSRTGGFMTDLIRRVDTPATLTR